MCETSSFIAVCETSSFIAVCETSSFIAVCETSSFIAVCETSSFIAVCETSSFIAVCETSSFIAVCETSSFIAVCETSSFIAVCETSSFIAVCETSSFIEAGHYCYTNTACGALRNAVNIFTIIHQMLVSLYISYAIIILSYYPIILVALHLWRQTFRVSSTTPRFFFFEIHRPITVSMNNRSTLCSYYVSFSATLCEQLRTTVQQHAYFLRLSEVTQHKDKTSLDVDIFAIMMRILKLYSRVRTTKVSRPLFINHYLVTTLSHKSAVLAFRC